MEGDAKLLPLEDTTGIESYQPLRELSLWNSIFMEPLGSINL